MLQDCARFPALHCCHFDATITDKWFRTQKISVTAKHTFEHRIHFLNTSTGCVRGHLADFKGMWGRIVSIIDYCQLCQR